MQNGPGFSCASSELPTQPLLYAIEQNDLVQVKQLLNEDERVLHTPLLVEQTWGSEWWLPIHVAAYFGSIPILELLFSRNVQPDSRTRYRTPFHARATALHLAASNGHTSAIDLLLSSGAEPDLLDAHQQSPLWHAAHGLKVKAVEALLEAGAHPGRADANQRTPLHAALIQANQQIQASDRQQDLDWVEDVICCVSQLIQAGADPQAQAPKDTDRQTPRLLADHLVTQLTDTSLKDSLLALFD